MSGWKGVPPLPRASTNLAEGTTVYVVTDQFLIIETKTRSAPWLLGGGEWVVMLEGRSGGFSLDRVFLPPTCPHGQRWLIGGTEPNVERHLNCEKCHDAALERAAAKVAK